MDTLRRRAPVSSAFNRLSRSLRYSPAELSGLEPGSSRRPRQHEEDGGNHRDILEETCDDNHCTLTNEDVHGGKRGSEEYIDVQGRRPGPLAVDSRASQTSHIFLTFKAFMESLQKEVVLQQTGEIQLKRRILLLLEGNSEEYKRSFGMPLPDYGSMSQPLGRMRNFFHKSSNDKYGDVISNAKETFKRFLRSEDLVNNQSRLLSAVDWLSKQCML
eukprot:CAMPEP_0185263014 /NCGR_PEP_ID=MMETSP1359-20130426/11019_1 /TAXON_ID=552665 /ORGANISM="Bigelowiella longifila, Strain CCMP242" /LENGTH=215 /DNA_ID=CAMNT_0027850109 /DNA_START=40 /DNA_END=687 /DNA_ORIENTATION=-